MPNFHVNRRSTVKLTRIEGELKVGSKAKIEASEGNLVVVTGDAYFEGAAELNCNFECNSLRADHGGVLKVNGNLKVHKKLDIVHSIEAAGSVNAEEIDVGGKIYAKSIDCKKMRAGGIVVATDSLTAESVDVGGKVLAPGAVRIVNLGVGGHAEVGGGSISGNIRIGGKFESRRALEFGDLQGFGRITLLDKCKGRRISTFGKLSAASDLDCDEIDVDGVTEVQGNCVAKRVEVNGKFGIQGSLECSGPIEVYGSIDIQQEVKSTSLRIGGKFRASRAEITGEVDLAGVAETTRGLRGDAIIVRSGSRCMGPIIGNRIEVGRSSVVIANWNKKWAGQLASIHLIGRMTRVEDIYGREVLLGSSSRSGRVFSETVEVNNGTIAEEILYTTELRGPLDKGYFHHPPRRVAELPVPPN